MPISPCRPEELGKFYDVLISGRADFANGVRLVYPMEDKAMQFFNLCANKFFGIAFSWALGQPLKDTLCGTKVLFKDDYARAALAMRRELRALNDSWKAEGIAPLPWALGSITATFSAATSVRRKKPTRP